MNNTNTLQTASVILPFMPCVIYIYVYLVTFISMCYDPFHKWRINSDLPWSIWKIAAFFSTLVKWALMSFNLYRWQCLICKKSEENVSERWQCGDSDSDKSSTYNSYPCKHIQSTCEPFSCKVEIFLWMRYYVWGPYYIKKWIILMFFSHIIHLNTLTNRAT